MDGKRGLQSYLDFLDAFGNELTNEWIDRCMDGRMDERLIAKNDYCTAGQYGAEYAVALYDH